MKRILKISIIALSILLINPFRNTASAQFSASISFQTFYDDLSPYGQWIDYPQYGYVWNPNVGAGFRPYNTMGHWEWSGEYDWIWVSDYDWGWAPFHYGRWFYDPFYGWLWVPGYDWSPAWVAWRTGGDFYGWAPISPGININISIGSYAPPVDYWCFAPRRYITSPRIYDYCVSSRMNQTIVHNTTIINNYNFYGGRGRNTYVNGPRRNEAERYTGQRIRPVAFRDSDRPGRTEFRNNSISIYRPRVEKNDNNRFAPRSFDRYNERPQANNGIIRENNAFDRGNNLPQRNDRNNVNNNGTRQNMEGWQNRNDRKPFEQRTNNLPQRNDQNQVNPFERRQPQSQNSDRNGDRRNVENQDKNHPTMNDNRNFKPFERRNPAQNDSRNFGNQDNNRFNNNNKNSGSFDRRPQPNRDNNRDFDNRNFGNRNNNQPRQMEQPRQFERRNEGNPGQGNKNFNKGGGRNKG